MTSITRAGTEDPSWRVAERVGVRVLLVHALHNRAAEFYASLGFKPSPTDPLHLYVLLADARASLETLR